MYHSDLREELKFLKARLLYKAKKLDAAVAANEAPEKLECFRQDIREIEEKLHICQTELAAQTEAENDDRKTSAATD